MSEFSGKSNSQTWSDIKRNLDTLGACPKHKFSGGKVVAMGARYTCLNCGGVMDLRSIGQYLKGYAAAGGDINEIWNGWSQNG